MRVLILTVFLSNNFLLAGQQGNLELVEQFALDYEPIPEEGKIVPTLDQIPENISRTFKQLRSEGKSVEKALTLILVKLYRAHLNCCHQSYELRTQNFLTISADDPVVFELNQLINRFSMDETVEFISSAIIMDWIEQHPELLNYEPIKRAHLEIMKIERKIENGDYWKK